MRARATAPCGISVVNAILAGRGATAAIDRTVEAAVDLDPGRAGLTVETPGRPDVDPTLARSCVEAVCARHGASAAGTVEVAAEVPPSVGLKTSSATANAVVVATLAALDRWDAVDRLEAARLGVEVARSVGVTVTGAFDDAAASMLGGLAITDNRSDDLLDRRDPDWAATIVIPEGGEPAAAVDEAALASFATVGDLAVDLVLDGRTRLGMTVNGLAVAAALELSTEPIRTALDVCDGVSHSGTGPAVAAVGSPDACAAVAERWAPLGSVVETELRAEGTTVS